MNTGKNLKVNVQDIICMCPACLHGEGDYKNGNYIDNWRGIDMNKFEDIPADLTLWKSCKICKNIGCREEYQWHDTLTILVSKNTYDELHDYVKKIHCHFLIVISMKILQTVTEMK